MNDRCSTLKAIAAVLVVAMLGAGCATHKLVNPAPVGMDWDYTYWSVVQTVAEGGVTPDPAANLERLKAYYKALQEVAGLTNLEDQYIGCYGCDRLMSTTVPPSQLKFIFYRVHLDNMHAFTRAMKRVQASALADRNFVLIYNTDPAPSPACPTSCKPKIVCVKYSGCDGNGATPLCDPCP